MRNTKSFTIVELLVVMAVIGVLLSLAVFGIQALQKSQRETQRMQDLKNIQGSLESFYSKYKFYPKSAMTQDWSELTAVGGTDFKIYYNKGHVDERLFATIPIQSLTPTVIGGVYNSTPDVCNTNIANADNWFVVYASPYANGNFTTPQRYGLFACTENGKTSNLGSFNEGQFTD